MPRYKTESSTGRWLLWLGGAAVLALLLWAISQSGMFRTVAPQAATPDSGATPGATTAALSDFQRYVDERSPADASASHDYTAGGFRRLAAALESARDGDDVVTAARGIRERADSMQHDSGALTHARYAREAALLTSALLNRLHDGGDSAAAERVRDVNEAALAIRIDDPLLSQAEVVHSFFVQAARAIGDGER